MRRKQTRQGQGAETSNRNGKQLEGAMPNSAGADARPAPDRFRANVFTWTGPGIENIFIDFDAKQRKRRRLWKDGDPDSRGAASERAENNG
jgi:hypothetical protein